MTRAIGYLLVMREVALFSGESLDRRQHVEIAFGGRNHRDLGLARLAGDQSQPPPDQFHQDEKHRHQKRYDNRHRRIDQEQQHHCTGSGEQHRRGICQRRGEEAAEVVRLIGHQREQGAALAVLVKFHRHQLHVFVDVLPQPGQDAERCRRGRDRRGDIEHRKAHQRGHQQAEQLPEVLRRAVDNAAEHLARQPGHCERRKRTQHGQSADQQELAAKLFGAIPEEFEFHRFPPSKALALPSSILRSWSANTGQLAAAG